jgi:hypothetical protein
MQMTVAHDREASTGDPRASPAALRRRHAARMALRALVTWAFSDEVTSHSRGAQRERALLQELAIESIAEELHECLGGEASCAPQREAYALSLLVEISTQPAQRPRLAAHVPPSLLRAVIEHSSVGPVSRQTPPLGSRNTDDKNPDMPAAIVSSACHLLRRTLTYALVPGSPEIADLLSTLFARIGAAHRYHIAVHEHPASLNSSTLAEGAGDAAAAAVSAASAAVDRAAVRVAPSFAVPSLTRFNYSPASWRMLTAIVDLLRALTNSEAAWVQFVRTAIEQSIAPLASLRPADLAGLATENGDAAFRAAAAVPGKAGLPAAARKLHLAIGATCVFMEFYPLGHLEITGAGSSVLGAAAGQTAGDAGGGCGGGGGGGGGGGAVGGAGGDTATTAAAAGPTKRHPSQGTAISSQLGINPAVALVCDNDEERRATWRCVECGNRCLCDECDRVLHLARDSRDHRRVAILWGGGADDGGDGGGAGLGGSGAGGLAGTAGSTSSAGQPHRPTAGAGGGRANDAGAAGGPSGSRPTAAASDPGAPSTSTSTSPTAAAAAAAAATVVRVSAREGGTRVVAGDTLVYFDRHTLRTTVRFNTRCNPQTASLTPPLPTKDPVARCEETLACGHRCNGIAGETMCAPCIVPACSRASRCLVDAVDACPICWHADLGAAPVVALLCGHILHLACARARIEARWRTPWLSFAFCECPLCRAPMVNEHLDGLMGPIVALRDAVRFKALARLRLEGREASTEITDPASPWHGNPGGYAMRLYAFLPCSRCGEPYFGGRRDELAPLAGTGPGGALPHASELVCGVCSMQENAFTSCPKHGRDFIEHKCRFCCSVAVVLSRESMHLCAGCYAVPVLRRLAPASLTQCPVGPGSIALPRDAACPLAAAHPPTGQPHVLGCGLCRHALGGGDKD